MNDLFAFVGLAVLVFAFFWYWLNSRRAREGLDALAAQRFKPDVICNFLSSGYKIAFEHERQKIAFVNVEYVLRSNNPLDGRESKTHKLSQIHDYDYIKAIKIHRSFEDGALSNSGLIAVTFNDEGGYADAHTMHSEITMGFSHHDATALSLLEANWPLIVRINP